MTEIAFKESAKHIPLDGVITFGVHKGKTVKQVADEKPGYLVWAIKNVAWFELTRDARKYAQRRLNAEANARLDRMAFGGIFGDSPHDDEHDDGPDEAWGMSYSDFGNN